MRIALVGAHETGKSTLAGRLAVALPGYEMVDEPYRTLEAEGHQFADPPVLADFEDQLNRSIADLAIERDCVLFDRSPVDIFAYLRAVGGADQQHYAEWFNSVRLAVVSLDLLVFVPIERPDVIDAGSVPRLRRAVDRILRAALIDDEWGLGVQVLEVSGTPDIRVGQVLAWLE